MKSLTIHNRIRSTSVRVRSGCVRLGVILILRILVLEYLEGGELIWTNESGQNVLSEDLARKYFRDVVRGLEYCASYCWQY